MSTLARLAKFDAYKAYISESEAEQWAAQSYRGYFRSCSVPRGEFSASVGEIPGVTIDTVCRSIEATYQKFLAVGTSQDFGNMELQCLWLLKSFCNTCHKELSDLALLAYFASSLSRDGSRPAGRCPPKSLASQGSGLCRSSG